MNFRIPRVTQSGSLGPRANALTGATVRKVGLHSCPWAGSPTERRSPMQIGGATSDFVFDLNSDRSIGARHHSTGGDGSKQPASDVDMSLGKRTSEKVETWGKDCNALGLAAKAVKYPARRGASPRASNSRMTISAPIHIAPRLPMDAERPLGRSVTLRATSQVLHTSQDG